MVILRVAGVNGAHEGMVFYDSRLIEVQAMSFLALEAVSGHVSVFLQENDVFIGSPCIRGWPYGDVAIPCTRKAAGARLENMHGSSQQCQDTNGLQCTAGPS
jgi:hypothetical protein